MKKASSTTQSTGVMVVGAQGRMGLEVRAALEDEPSLHFAGALERSGHDDLGRTLSDGVRLQDDPKAALEGCGIAIDFSIPTATIAIGPSPILWVLTATNSR